MEEKKNSVLVLGIDQGLSNIGYCVMKVYKDLIERPVIIEHGTLTTKSNEDTPKRLGYIYDSLEAIARKYPEMDFIGCEQLFYSGPRSSSIIPTNLATGVIFLLANRLGKEIKDYSPTSVKKIMTGSGKAEKEDIAKAIQYICEINDVQRKGMTNHEDDAIAIAYTVAKDYYMEITKKYQKKLSKKVHKDALEMAECIDSLVEKIYEEAFADEKKTPANMGLTINDYTKNPRLGVLKTIKDKSKQYSKFYGCNFQMDCFINVDRALLEMENVQQEASDKILSKEHIKKNIDVFSYDKDGILCTVIQKGPLLCRITHNDKTNDNRFVETVRDALKI